MCCCQHKWEAAVGLSWGLELAQATSYGAMCTAYQRYRKRRGSCAPYTADLSLWWAPELARLDNNVDVSEWKRGGLSHTSGPMGNIGHDLS